MITSSFGASCKHPATVEALRRQLAPYHPESSPSTYPEMVNLPFNRQALPESFVLHPSPQLTVAEPGYWVLLQGSSVLLKDTDSGLILPSGETPAWLPDKLRPLCFAGLHGKPVYAVHLTGSCQLTHNLVSEPFNAFQERIPADLMSVAGLGKQVMHWQRMSCFCSHCGGTLVQLPETWGKKCVACSTEHYPHIHPCAIVLIRRGDQLLLIHKPEWPQGRYSLVAGFLDMGESLEECAIREAFEETGVTIRNVRYVASQAWPFPAQLMAGFISDYSSGDIKVDGKEIDDARWFTIGSMPSLPASRSIARYLIDTFGSN